MNFYFSSLVWGGKVKMSTIILILVVGWIAWRIYSSAKTTATFAAMQANGTSTMSLNATDNTGDGTNDYGQQ